MQANHGGVRGKLPKEAEDEEVMEGTADDNDEIMATPDDEVKEEKIHSTVYIYHTYLELMVQMEAKLPKKRHNQSDYCGIFKGWGVRENSIQLCNLHHPENHNSLLAKN